MSLEQNEAFQSPKGTNLPNAHDHFIQKNHFFPPFLLKGNPKRMILVFQNRKTNLNRKKIIKLSRGRKHK